MELPRCAPSERRLTSLVPLSTTWPACERSRAGSMTRWHYWKRRCPCDRTRDWSRPPIPTSHDCATSRASRRWSASSGGLADPVEDSQVRDGLAQRDRHGPVVQHAVAERLDHELVLIDLIRPVERPPEAISALVSDHRQLLVLRRLEARPHGRRLAAREREQ